MKVKVINLHPKNELPKYQTKLAAGFDFHAALGKNYILKPGERYAIPSGLAMEIPEGYALFIFSRSGLGRKFGIAMANGVGVIDADYRGEISVLLTNNGDEDFIIEPGMRIAQGIIIKHETAEWEEVDELEETEREKSGFGSTGIE